MPGDLMRSRAPGENTAPKTSQVSKCRRLFREKIVSRPKFICRGDASTKKMLRLRIASSAGEAFMRSKKALSEHMRSMCTKISFLNGHHQQVSSPRLSNHHSFFYQLVHSGQRFQRLQISHLLGGSLGGTQGEGCAPTQLPRGGWGGPPRGEG